MNTRFWVMFSDANVYNRWWQIFLKRPFYHCSLWVRLHGSEDIIQFSWVEINKRNEKQISRYKVYNGQEEKFFNIYIALAHNQGKDTKLIEVENNYFDNYNLLRFIREKIFPNCVSRIAGLLNFNSSYVFTPYQFYKKLLAREGKEFIHSDEEIDFICISKN